MLLEYSIDAPAPEKLSARLSIHWIDFNNFNVLEVCAKH